MKRTALQNKQFAVLEMAFRTRIVFGTFQKRAPDPWDAGAVLKQLGDQAKWELVIMWVYDKPIDSGYWFTYIMLRYKR